MARPKMRRSTTIAPSRRRSFVMRQPAVDGGLKQVDEVQAPVVKENWADDAYAFAEAIGEVGYVLNLTANTAGRCKIRPEVRVPGTDEWVETDDARVLRVLAAFKPPEGGGHGELLRQAVLHYQIAGEAYLFGAPVRDERGKSAGLLWEFLSTLEIKVDRSGKVTRNAWGGGSQGQTGVDVEAYVARLHHRDPRFSQRVDCAMRRVLPICRELVLLTQVIDAVAKSRLPAGVLYVPWEASLGPTNEYEDPALPESGPDPLEADLAEHLNAPIEDRTSPSSLNPLLWRGPAFVKGTPMKDLIGNIDITRPLDALYKELRDEALARLGAGLDIPPEIMSGKGGINHWGSYHVDDDFVAKHVIPLGDKVISFITSAYLRPMLAIFEDMAPSEAEWFRFALDTSPITAETDLSDNATTGHALEVVSDVAWVRHNGLDEDDMPDEEERLRRTLERLLFAQPTLGPAILPALYPDKASELAPVFEKWEVGQSAPGGAQAPPIGAPAVPKPPAPRSGGREPGAPPPSVAGVDPTVFATIITAADRDLDRALERAANRLISRLNGVDKVAADRLRAADRKEALALAGPSLAARAGLGRDELFSGCWDDLSTRVAGWLATALIRSGVEPIQAMQRSEAAATELAAQLTLHASSALDRPIRVGENGFKVPTTLVASALTAGDLSRV